MPSKEQDPATDIIGMPVIDCQKHALFFDVDGTLLDIAANPDGVIVPAELQKSISVLSECLSGAMALVTGRSIAFIEERFPDYHGPIAALHGAEFRHASGLVELIAPDEHFLIAKDFLRQAALRVSGFLAEDKGGAVALHYRAAPEKADLAHDLVDKALKLAGADWIVQSGKMVFELRPAVSDKGAALRRFMGEKPFAGRVPVAFGDDLTDLSMLEAAAELNGKAVVIGRAIDLARAARLGNPDELRLWLSGITDKHSNERT
ncbi:trehalose-phosphatase [Brucella oryzae]|uniref:Trehalose 6-phosphate phosphatase n=1 Tax=Brucella oryzae TaxID=335286 RepID=A0A2S7J0K5_9HYPH|nr:trehalose-phosphatase [Brucella oryzae]PQA73791.1 trehalose-phosphatase [Brucella oryzae]